MAHRVPRRDRLERRLRRTVLPRQRWYQNSRSRESGVTGNGLDQERGSRLSNCRRHTIRPWTDHARCWWSPKLGLLMLEGRLWLGRSYATYPRWNKEQVLKNEAEGAYGLIWPNTEKLTRSRWNKDWQIESSFLIFRVVEAGAALKQGTKPCRSLHIAVVTATRYHPLLSSLLHRYSGPKSFI